MTTSRRAAPTAIQGFTKQAVELAWGAWSELGVSGWAQTHRDWAIDPEPLIVFTSWIGDEDARLRDEATDWCIRNWRHVSKVRLRNLARSQSPAVEEAFGEFAATVGEHAGVSWPLATRPRQYTVTGRSTAPELKRPSMAWLRLRSIFGLGARTEILRYFLATGRSRVSVAAIADAVGYNKRNVADECEGLYQAGVLSVRQVRNRFHYSLTKRAELEALLGEVAAVQPDWTAVLDVARCLVTFEWESERSTPRVVVVSARTALRGMEPALGELDIEGPGNDVTGDALVEELRTLGAATLGEWSKGLPAHLDTRHDR